MSKDVVVHAIYSREVSAVLSIYILVYIGIEQ